RALFQDNANPFRKQANAAAARPGAPPAKVEEQPKLATVKPAPSGTQPGPQPVKDAPVTRELAKAELAKPEATKADPVKPEPAKDASAQTVAMGEYNLQPVKGWEGRAAIVTGELPTAQKSGSVYFVFNLIPSSPAQVLASATSDKSSVKALIDRAEGASNGG